MIILDMDGTLLNSNGIILESSKEILKNLKQMGKIIVIATGRALGTALPYLTEDFVDYIITNHGAVWYNLKDRKIILKYCLNNKSCIDIIKRYYEDISRIHVMNSELYKFDNLKEAIKFLENNEAIHLNIHLKDYKKSKEIAEIIRNEYEDLYAFLMQDSFCEKQWIDIICKGNNKGISIRKLIDYLGINYDDTICFGDSLNDIEMFKNVKTSVAMKNALPELKQVATHITDNYDNDGIYKFLNNYFFKEEK